MARIQEFRDLTDEELRLKLESLQRELFNLRLQAQAGQLDNPVRLRIVRRDIARAKTLAHERERERAAGR